MLAMGDIHEVPRPRIATGQLAQHIGQPVCFVGRVEKVRGALGGVWERDCGYPVALCGKAGAVPEAARRLQPAWEQGGRRTELCGEELAEAAKAFLCFQVPLERTGLMSFANLNVLS